MARYRSTFKTVFAVTVVNLVVFTSSAYSDSESTSCVCVPFDRCQDGELVNHGDSIIDIRMVRADECRGFDVCCNVVQPLFDFLSETSKTEGDDSGDVMVSFQDISDHAMAATDSSQKNKDVDTDGSSTDHLPCICMQAHMCEEGSLESSKASEMERELLSSTGRCSNSEQICCTVTFNQSESCICATSYSVNQSESCHCPPESALSQSPDCECVSAVECEENLVMASNGNCTAEQVCCAHQVISELNETTQSENATTGEYNQWAFCKAYPLSVGCPRTRKWNTLPTVRAVEDFDPEVDAKTIRKELRIGGAIGRTLISILANRTYSQRHIISQHYLSLYGNELYDDVSFWTIGQFENTVQSLLKATSFAEYQAIMLYEAMSGLGTDEDAVIETIITSTPEELDDIKAIYERLTGETLETSISNDFSRHIRRILLASLGGKRNSSRHIDLAEAKRHAQALYEAGQGVSGTDEDTFDQLLTEQNYAQLALTMSEYQTLTGYSLEDAVESEFSGETENVLLAIVQTTRNVPNFFATRLQAITRNLRRDDADLIRILVSRSEKDLATIMHEYKKMYNEDFASRIEWKTTGNYEDILLALIGSPQN